MTTTDSGFTRGHAAPPSASRPRTAPRTTAPAATRTTAPTRPSRTPGACSAGTGVTPSATLAGKARRRASGAGPPPGPEGHAAAGQPGSRPSVPVSLATSSSHWCAWQAPGPGRRLLADHEMIAGPGIVGIGIAETAHAHAVDRMRRVHARGRAPDVQTSAQGPVSAALGVAAGPACCAACAAKRGETARPRAIRQRHAAPAASQAARSAGVRASCQAKASTTRA